MANRAVVPLERIQSRILLIRGEKVLLDADLAKLYGTTTKRLNEQVRRNRKRFPDDFMFRLTGQEVTGLRSQIATSKTGSGGRRYLPYVFTEQGVAMLSSVLSTERAIEMNVLIMRAFVQLRGLLTSQEQFTRRLAALERKRVNHDEQLGAVFDAIRQLMAPPAPRKKRQIGFANDPKKK